MRNKSLAIRSLWITALFSLLFFIFSFYSSLQKSLTSDEVVHIPGGFMIWKTGDYRINLEHPPLVKLWAALPLLPFGFNVPTYDPDWKGGEEWHFGAYFLYQYNDADLIAMLSRFSIIALGMILGWVIYGWGRALAGRSAGRLAPLAGLFAAVLYFTEPNIIAHSSLVTYDLAFALIVAVCGYLYWSLYFRRFTFWRLFLFAFCMALAPLVKIVGLFLWFLLFLHFAGMALVSPHPWRFQKPGGETIRLRKKISKTAVTASAILVCGILFLILVWGIYGFRYRISPGHEIPPGPQAARFLDFSNEPSPFVRNTLFSISKNRLLPQGFLSVLSHAFMEQERATFLMGEVRYGGGFLHYYVVTALLKTPLLHLALFIAMFCYFAWWGAAGVFRRKSRRFGRSRYLAVRASIPLYLAAGFFLIISFSRVNLGHRLVLMVIPLECLVAGVFLTHLFRRIRPSLQKILFAMLLICILIPPVAGFPHYISYFNPLIGSREKAGRYLLDSNVDWGQDIKLLADFLGKNGITRVNLSLFGTADPFYHGLKSWNDIGSYLILIPRNPKGPPDPTLPTAVSVNMLSYIVSNHPGVMTTDTPVIVGQSIFVFPPAKASNK